MFSSNPQYWVLKANSQEFLKYIRHVVNSNGGIENTVRLTHHDREMFKDVITYLYNKEL